MHHPGFTRFVDLAPGRVVGNQDLPVPFANIRERTGILTRNFASPDESVESLALRVSRMLFEKLEIAGADCTGLILTSSTAPTPQLIETANRVADRLNISGTIDAINFACSGFTAATDIAAGCCRKGQGHVLLLSVELLSRMVDFREEKTAILFGDRAAATTVHPNGRFEIVDAWAAQLVDDKHMIWLEPTPNALDEQGVVTPRTVLRLHGKDLYRMAPGKMLELALQEGVVKTHDRPFRIVYHQANGKFGGKMRKLLEKAGISNVEVIDHIQHMGNVASSSIPSTLAKIQNELKPGDLVACPAVGGGPDLQPGTMSEGIVVIRVRE